MKYFLIFFSILLISCDSREKKLLATAPTTNGVYVDADHWHYHQYSHKTIHIITCDLSGHQITIFFTDSTKLKITTNKPDSFLEIADLPQ